MWTPTRRPSCTHLSYESVGCYSPNIQPLPLYKAATNLPFPKRMRGWVCSVGLILELLAVVQSDVLTTRPLQTYANMHVFTMYIYKYSESRTEYQLVLTVNIAQATQRTFWATRVSYVSIILPAYTHKHTCSWNVKASYSYIAPQVPPRRRCRHR